MNRRIEDEPGCKMRIRIVHDSDPEQPGDDLVKISYATRSRYVLGTEAVTEDQAWELGERMKHGCLVGIPVYAYVHSGSTVRCSENGNLFDCPWDSRRSGLAYIDMPKVVAEFGEGPEAIEKAKVRIRSAVELFDVWLRGEVYGFVAETWSPVYDKAGETAGGIWVAEDCCQGFYGDDWRTNGIKDYVREYLDRGFELREDLYR